MKTRRFSYAATELEAFLYEIDRHLKRTARIELIGGTAATIA